ncbi:M28 family peptidase [Altererythrobacter sp. Z27]|uniref:M28 family peptidase n=1 Tax=Altererythrobacter sp. Z27 TaxID=3461147 RepID=UPI004044F9B1
MTDLSDVIAFGAERSTLGGLVAAAAIKSGITLSPDPMPQEGLFIRSDQYMFIRQGVPSVYLFPGLGNDGGRSMMEFIGQHYHKPTDDFGLPIDWKAAAKFADVNASIAPAIATAEVEPRWYEEDFFADLFAPAEAREKRP